MSYTRKIPKVVASNPKMIKASKNTLEPKNPRVKMLATAEMSALEPVIAPKSAKYEPFVFSSYPSQIIAKYREGTKSKSKKETPEKKPEAADST